MQKYQKTLCLCALFMACGHIFAQSLIKEVPIQQAVSAKPLAQSPPEPIICKTGIYIQTIQIHQQEEVFDVLFYWWFRVDSVDPKINYADIADIEFVNADTELGVDKKNEDLSKGFYYVTGRCKATIPYKANYANFPFDTQMLEISIENKNNNIDSIVYVPEDKGPFMNELKQNNIEILNGDQYSISQMKCENSVYTYKTNFGDPGVKGNEQYSRISFIVDLQRNPAGILQKLALPLLVVLILAYLVFYIPDYEIGTASALTVTALLAAIAFQWTLNDSLPKVSYMTIVDKIFYLVYSFIFYAMAQTVITFNMSKLGDGMKKLSHRIEVHSRYLFPALFCILLLLLLK